MVWQAKTKHHGGRKKKPKPKPPKFPKGSRGPRYLAEHKKKIASKKRGGGEYTKKRNRARTRGVFSYEKWWEENRDRVLAGKKQRYHTDPAYREAIKAASRRNSKARRERKKVEKARQENPLCRMPRPKVIEVEGRKVLLYSLGHLLKHSGLVKNTLRKWLDRGVLPRCQVTDSKGWHWFPEQYIEFVQEMAAYREQLIAEGGQQWFLEKFRVLVWGRWIDKWRRRMPSLANVVME